MIIIPIDPEDIKVAIAKTKEFDEQKTYDKFICENNYIGLLGEITLHKFLLLNHIEHTWVNFIKKSMNEPDFILAGNTVDLKTTYSNTMWIQKPKFDIYIYAQLTPDNQFMVIQGFMTGSELKGYIADKSTKQVKRGSRVDYVFSKEDMLPLYPIGLTTVRNNK